MAKNTADDIARYDIEDSTSSELDARHMVASAAGNISAVAAQIACALAWQRGQQVSTINDLETALTALATAQRQLQEAIVELRLSKPKT